MGRCGLRLAMPVLMVALGMALTGEGRGLEVSGPRNLAEALDTLTAAEWPRREAAQAYLMRQPADKLEAVEKRFETTRDPEVLARLEKVAEHLFLKGHTPLVGRTPLLGISLDFEPRQVDPESSALRMEVVVKELQPGYPAAEVLRPGDRIVTVNARGFEDDVDIVEFRETIAEHRAGETLTLKIIRSRTAITVRVVLAGMPENTTELTDYMMQRRSMAWIYMEGLRAKARPETGLRGSDDIQAIHGMVE